MSNHLKAEICLDSKIIEGFFSFRHSGGRKTRDNDPRTEFMLVFDGNIVVAGARIVINHDGHKPLFIENRAKISLSDLMKQKIKFDIKNYSTAEICGITVKEDYRGKGLAIGDAGKLLYTSCIRYCQDENVDILFVAPYPNDRLVTRLAKTMKLTPSLLAEVTVSDDNFDNRLGKKRVLVVELTKNLFPFKSREL